MKPARTLDVRDRLVDGGGPYREGAQAKVDIDPPPHRPQGGIQAPDLHAESPCLIPIEDVAALDPDRPDANRDRTELKGVGYVQRGEDAS